MNLCRNLKLQTLAFLLAYGAFQSAALGNPTPIGSPGTSLLPFSLKAIQGISIATEALTIKDGAKSYLPAVAPGGKPLEVSAVDYHATYRFQNRTGSTKRIRVGFPLVTYAHRAGDSHGGLSSFSIRYGGKQIPHTEVPRSTPLLYPIRDLQGITEDLVSTNLANVVPEAPDFVNLSKLGKTATEAKRLLISSKKLPASKIATIMAILRQIRFGECDWTVKQQTLIWYAFDLALPQGLSLPLEVSYKSISSHSAEDSITYLLRTAKYWNGPIGQLQITFEPDREFLRTGGRYEILPKKIFQEVHGSYVFTSKNVSPQWDVQIQRKNDTSN